MPGTVKSDRQERLYHIDDAPTGMSDVFREGDKLYEVCNFFSVSFFSYGS